MMRCGLLGEKLGHSYSPAIHAQLADYAYGLYEVAPEDLPAFLTGGDFDALNVTIPYKKAVIPYCAELIADHAQKLGSSGTCSSAGQTGHALWQIMPMPSASSTSCVTAASTLRAKGARARQRRRIRDHSGRARAARRARDGHLPPWAG